MTRDSLGDFRRENLNVVIRRRITRVYADRDRFVPS